MLNYLKTVPGETPLIVEGYFAVSPERMFEAWTTPDIVQQWFGRDNTPLYSAEIDLTVGGRWRFIRESNAEHTMGLEGEYLEIEHDRRLVFSWRHVVSTADGNRTESPTSRVEVNFVARGVGTQVTLTHSGLSSREAREGVGGGWEASFGKILTRFVAPKHSPGPGSEQQ